MENYETNKHLIQIRKGCISCAHKGYDYKEKDENLRLCKLDHERHPRCFLCERWEMHPGLENAGNSGGRVKRREYLEYLTAIRAEETKGEPRDTESIRKEFEDLYGPVFVNF